MHWPFSMKLTSLSIQGRRHRRTEKARSRDFASDGVYFCWGTNVFDGGDLSFSFPWIEAVVRESPEDFEILHCRFTNSFLVNTVTIRVHKK